MSDVYDGRNWSPYAPEVTRFLGPPVAGEDCYTAQYAVLDAAADAAVAIKSVSGAGVVEVKPLPPSAMLPGAAAVCFNIYVRAGAALGWPSRAAARRGRGDRRRASAAAGAVLSGPQPRGDATVSENDVAEALAIDAR